jgi:chemotaxis protein histidine kinase CheA/CheY-like chemotaxis protein
MNGPGQEFVELFLEEASEHLQFLREYSGVLLDQYPLPDDIERLYIAAHGLAGTAGTYGYKLFSEVTGKLAHIFQYAMNSTIGADACAPLVEFINEAIAVLESDLLMISANAVEAEDDIKAFKQRYPFAFQQPPAAQGPAAKADKAVSPPHAGAEPASPAVPEGVLARLHPPVSPQRPAPASVTEAATPASPGEAALLSPPTVGVQAAPAASQELSADAVVPVAWAESVAADDVIMSELETAAVISELALKKKISAVAEPEPLANAAVATAGAVEVPPHWAAAAAPAASVKTVTAPLPAIVRGQPPAPEPSPALEVKAPGPAPARAIPDLPPDGDVPADVLEFFVPEMEEHLQTITESLLLLEAHPNPNDINKLFRSMHTIKGSAGQLGLRRLSAVAHRAEDLMARLRNGELQPSARIVDLCLESVDILKRQLYGQWPDEQAFQQAAKSFFRRIDEAENVPAELAAPEPEEITQPFPAEAEAEPAPQLPPPVEVAVPAPLAGAEVESGFEEVEPEPVQVRAAPSAAAISRDMALPAAGAAAVEPAEPGIVPAGATAAFSGGPGEEIAALAAGRREPAGVPQSKSVRIALERLDRMMNAVGELVTNRTRMLGRLQELEKLADVLNFSKARMIDKISEFQEKYEFSRLNLGSLQTPGHNLPRRSPLREEKTAEIIQYPFRGGYSSYKRSFDASLAEFSELEMDRYDDFGILSRSLTEISADITEVLTQLDGFVRRVDSDIDEFTKLAHRLQDEITQSRMVPIGNLYTRISRAVRDSAKAAGKRVELVLAGAETELDNNIVQQIADPLVHLVRNAVAHGIERAEERYNSGKSDSGTLAIRAYHRGNHIFIEVEDDGRGIDYEKIRTAAVDLELIDEERARTLSQHELLDLMFLPGFSTAPRKTELAGRGVGLDVVRTNIEALNGEVEIETQKGIGTRFTLKVPLTLIISQALFVKVGDNTFAFPLSFVEGIRRVRADEVEEAGGKHLVKVRDVLTEVIHPDQRLGLPPVEPVNGWYKLVLANVGGKQIGIVVEEVLGKDEIVIKNVGEYLHNVKMFPGATIAPDGSLILLVDLNRLIVGEAIERRPLMTAANAARIFIPGAAAVAAGEIPEEAIERVEKEKLVLLVDDSISVRKFVGRMLEKAGYRVRLASDGLEALDIVSQGGCNLVITDLEMPRTNGYELMLHLRQNPETRHIPVMVVTSRAGSKHRDRALREGARAFMVKPVQEEQLVAQVAGLIGSSGQAIASQRLAEI